MKPITCFFILFCFFVPLFAQAQKPKTDSLETLLKTAKQDTNCVNLLSQLAWQYITSYPEKTVQYANQGLSLVRKLKFIKGEILLLNYLGDCYRRQGQYARGVDYTTQSLQLAEQIKDSLGMADAYRLLGMIHSFSLHEYETALKYHHLALLIYERSKDKGRILALYSNFAWVYCMMNQQIPLASRYTEKALIIAKSLNDNQLIAWCINSKGLVADREEKLDSAIFYFRQSNEFARKVNDKAVTAYNNNLIGGILLRQGKYKEALSQFYQNILPIKAVKAKYLLSDAYEGISIAYTQKQKNDSALIFYKSHIALKDSLLNWETTQKVAIIEAEYEKEKKESKIESLEKERFIYLLVFGFILVVLLIFLLLITHNNRQRSKANKLLQEKNEEIAQQNEELQQSREEIATQRDLVEEKNKTLESLNQTKDKLFAIIGHDLRSPINSLKGLIGLVDEHSVSPEEFKLFSGKLRNGVEYVHFILNNLLEWANTQMQGILTHPQKIDLYQMSVENFNLLNELAQMKQIELNNQIEENAIAFADPDQINLVFRNLINNAIKFTEKNGKITLKSKLNESDCEITVHDTGIGMSEEVIAKLFDKTNHFTTYGTNGEKGTGLGLLLCEEMIEKNGGKLWVESVINKGTTFRFTLPLGNISSS